MILDFVNVHDIYWAIYNVMQTVFHFLFHYIPINFEQNI